LRRQKNVCRLYVAVNDPLVMGSLQRVANLERDAKNLN